MLVKGSVEDFLYIIVGVIWVAFSIYKGIKKKNEQKPKTQEGIEDEPEPVKKKSAFETFLDEIMVQEEPAPAQSAIYEAPSEAIPVVEEKEKSEVFSYDDYYEESNHETKIDVYKEADIQTKELKDQLKTSHKKSNRPRFDLRKAVIYSEILNRRYF